MSQLSSTPGVYNPTTTTTGPGSPAQQAFAAQQANVARQNAANQMATGGSKYRYKYKGGAIALAPLPNASPSAVALNAQVQRSGSQTAANSQYDCYATNSCPKGGRRRTRRNKKTKRSKKRRNTKRNKK
jgi:hypothetical protein